MASLSTCHLELVWDDNLVKSKNNSITQMSNKADHSKIGVSFGVEYVSGCSVDILIFQYGIEVGVLGDEIGIGMWNRHVELEFM